MPLYEYQCDECGRFELIQKMSDPALTVCPKCGREVQKLLSAPAIQFKGTGWYVTDYARKSPESKGAGAAPASEAASASNDAPSSKDGKDSKGSKESSTPQSSTSKDSPASSSGSSK